MKPTYGLSLLLLGLAACSQVPREAYFNRGAPESLLDASSEAVSVQLFSDQAIQEITDWVSQDQPTRAELRCQATDPVCVKAGEALKLYGVEYEMIASDEGVANLFYERVLARDCEHRYIDNHTNPYNLPHPAFGCSLASNMVQMVADKRQFVSPALQDPVDAEKAVLSYDKKYVSFKPEDAFKDGGDDFSLGNLKIGE